MNKKQWKALLKEALKISKEDDKIDKALRNFCNTISPTSSPFYIEKGQLNGFIRAVEVMYSKDVYEHVAHWVYDVQPSKHKLECSYNGKKYNAKNLNEYVDWILAQE
jgi:2-hydroxy-3-keto-5-methylthiopentenyl-1-phosphate phosphatase